jgi:flagellar hook-length control protein FliK
MTSLPIITSAPQTATSAKQTANSADTGDTQNSQPFGEVLARQISEPTAKDTKASGKLADALAQLGTDANAGKNKIADDKKTDAVATDGTSPLPADMLAALLPQAMNTSNTASATSSGTDSKTASTAIDATAGQGKSGIASLKASATGALQTGAAPKTATSAAIETPSGETPAATTFTAPANRTSAAGDLNAALREAVSIATQQPNTAPQTNAAALASLQNTAANVAAPAMQPVQLTVNTAVNQDKWSDEFSQKITWLASSNKDQTAELHLNPPQLGPLDVVIKVSGDQATALFTSPHAAVREAVEQAMPRLRDMLADNGIMLGNTTVSDQAPRDQSQANTQRSPATTGNIPDTPAVGNSATRVSPISRHNGIVDTFA